MGLLDGFGLAVDHLEDFGHEEHLLEGVADGVGILVGIKVGVGVGLYKLDSSLVLHNFRKLRGDGRLLNNFLRDILFVHLLHFHHLKLGIIIGLVDIMLHVHFLLGGNLSLIHFLLIFQHLLVGHILFGHLHVLLCIHLLLCVDYLLLCVDLLLLFMYLLMLCVDYLLLCVDLLLLSIHLLFLCVYLLVLGHHLLLGHLPINLLLGDLSVNLLLLGLLHLGLLHHHHLLFPLLFAQALEHCLFV